MSKDIKETEQALEPIENQENATTSEEEIVEETETKEPEEKMLPQSQVNSIAANERRKAQEQMLRDFGYEFETIEDGLKQHQDFLDSQKTEEEKRQEKLTQAEEEMKNKDLKIERLEIEKACLLNNVDSKAIDDVVSLAKTRQDDNTTIEQAVALVVKQYPQFKVQEENNVPNVVAKSNEGKETDESDFAKGLK